MINVSLVLSITICYIFAIASICVWWLSIKKGKNDELTRLFGWTWFFAAGIVGFMGIRTMLYGLGFIIWDLVFAITDQLFLVGFFTSGSLFILSKILQNRIAAKRIAYFLVAPLSLLAVLFIFVFMWQCSQNISPFNLNNVRAAIVNQRHTSDWGSEFIPPTPTMDILIPMFFSFLALLIYNIFRNLFPENKLAPNIYEIFLSSSLFIFLVALMFDQRGIDAGWKLLLYRMAGMSGALLAYLAISSKFEEDKL